MLRLQIIDQDKDTVLAKLILEDGTAIEVVTSVKLDGRRLILYNFHIDGPGPKALGMAGMYRVVKWVMEQYDVESIEIRGFRRTTGARPGHTPRPIVFRGRR